MSAPDQIWIDTEGRWTSFDASEMRRDPCIPYTRSDLIPDLIAEAVKKERERCLRIAVESEEVYGARGMNGMAKAARNIAAAIREGNG